jgi:hypothetical protein
MSLAKSSIVCEKLREEEPMMVKQKILTELIICGDPP